MADNSLRTPGSGESIASDDIGGVKHQRVKLEIGADGAAVDVQPPDADAQASASILPAGGLLWNPDALTWARARSASTAGNSRTDGIVAVVPHVRNATSLFLPVNNPATLGDGGDGTRVEGAVPFLYNGATYDRERGVERVVTLASAARTVTTAGTTQTNYNHRGIFVTLDITVASGTGGLSLVLYGVDGSQTSQLWSPGSPKTTVGRWSFMFYPGLATAPNGTGIVAVANGVLGRRFLLQVVVGDASSYTYELVYSLIP